jgi:hypothetical protein
MAKQAFSAYSAFGAHFSRKNGLGEDKARLLALIALLALTFLGNDGCRVRKTLSYIPPLTEISVDSLVAGW